MVIVVYPRSSRRHSDLDNIAPVAVHVALFLVASEIADGNVKVDIMCSIWKKWKAAANFD